MAITLENLKNAIKDNRGLTRAREDGLLSETLLEDAVQEAQELVVQYCNLFPVEDTFALEADKYTYPVDEEWIGLRRAIYIDSSGVRDPLDQVSPDEFLIGRNPTTDTSSRPYYYAFPKFQPMVIEPFAKAPPNKDYVEYSHITTDSIRTVIDSGINLGRTRTGRRISPGDRVWNLSDKPSGAENIFGSYGIVEVLDISTTKESGTADASTDSDTLVDAAATFQTNSVKVDDIIVLRNASGVTVTYAFVTEVTSETQLEYDAVRGEASALASGDTYRIGVANRIRLKSGAPHRGLRGGINNRFDIAAASATLTATTFTDTRVTGSGSLTSVSAGQVAIASGGSHGEVSEVGSGYLVVKHWIGGVPSAGEQVTVHTADKWHVETRAAIQRVICIGPTPTTTDDVGERSIMLLSNRRPIKAEEDWEELEVGEEYRRPLHAAAYWMVAEKSGLYANDPVGLNQFRAAFLAEVEMKMGDVHKTELDSVISPWINRVGGGSRGRRYQGRSGVAWNVRDQLG